MMSARMKKTLDIAALTAQLEAKHARKLASEAAKSAKNLKRVEDRASKQVAKADARAEKALAALVLAKEKAKNKEVTAKKQAKAAKQERALTAVKSKYTVRNWSEYNKALRDRGKISL